jgi:hypothetical protein
MIGQTIKSHSGRTDIDPKVKSHPVMAFGNQYLGDREWGLSVILVETNHGLGQPMKGSANIMNTAKQHRLYELAPNQISEDPDRFQSRAQYTRDWRD